ncbi:MaoC/PaaZ C-terminal domain-containing protein [Actinosynnema sp. NPDC020468]|uniref:MaoC family dehydratase n=1 Tax=Actinosynnema sp. NPDC020468 TaxID=3154488 RepID=UPI0033F44E9F
MANLTLLYAKAALTGFTRRGSTLPESTVDTGVTVDPAHLAAYNGVCGFGVRDELPTTYPHVLAFPAQIALMTGRGFPFPLPGLVHVANRITARRAVLAREPLTLRVRLANLRPHERGRQFDVVSTASVEGEEVWVDVSTYLRRDGGTGGTAERAGKPEPTAVWDLPGDLGRRYAAVSGDRNPIHLHPLAAKAFGFPRAIAHGMWTKARCLAAFEGRLPAAHTVDVRFKAPVLLPTRVDFSAEETGDGWRFALWSARPHLEGAITPVR